MPLSSIPSTTQHTYIHNLQENVLIPVLGRLRQKDSRFAASLSYLVRLFKI